MPKKKGSAVKTVVLSFRVSPQHEKALKKLHDDNPPRGVRTMRLLCRKVVLDYLAGRLEYKNPEHANENLEVSPKND